MDKLTALCNKCGWMGEVAPGLNSIPHDGCTYSACYSPTELKLYELVEAAAPFVADWIEAGELRPSSVDMPGDTKLSVNVTADQLNALRSAIKRAKGVPA